MVLFGKGFGFAAQRPKKVSCPSLPASKVTLGILKFTPNITLQLLKLVLKFAVLVANLGQLVPLREQDRLRTLVCFEQGAQRGVNVSRPGITTYTSSW